MACHIDGGWWLKAVVVLRGDNSVQMRLEGGWERGYGIVSPLMPGMTTPKSPEGQPGSGQRTVDSNGFHGVMGTTGVESAVLTEPGTEEVLIYPD
jgi:hypothetical protein